MFHGCVERGGGKASEVIMNGLLWSFNRLQLGLVLLAFGMGASLTWAQTPDTVKQFSAVPFKPLVFTVLDGASNQARGRRSG